NQSTATITTNPSLTTSANKKAKTTQTVTINKTQRTNALLSKLYAFANGIPPQNWSPARFLYKVGTLQLAGICEPLKTVATNETELLKEDAFRYSLIWALGRCGNASVLPLLDELVQEDEKEYIKRLTLEVYLKLAPPTAKTALLAGIQKLIPEKTLSILSTEDLSELSVGQINNLFPKREEQEIPPILGCYLLASERPTLRPAIIELLKNIPLKYPYFQSVRYIFKAAEFRNAFDILGILAYRLDVESKDYDSRFRWHWNREKRSYTRTSIRQPKSAFSNITKAYFQKRVLRNLRLLAEQEVVEYCQYAAHLLSHYLDEETAYKEESVSRYVYHNRQYHHTRSDYVTFKNVGFPWITKSAPNDAAIILWKNAKYRFDAPFFEQLDNRPIPHETLWQQHPVIVCQLLQTCQSEMVAKFAIHLLQANAQENDLITEKVVLNLLNSPLDEVAVYALQHLKRFFDPEQPTTIFLQAFINAPNTIIQHHLLETIEQYLAIYLKNMPLATALALSTQTDLAQWFGENGGRFTLDDADKTSIFEKLLSKIQTVDTGTAASILCHNCRSFFQAQMQQCPIEKTRDLSNHLLEQVQLLAADILLAQKTNIKNIPETAILQIMQADYLSVRCKGLELFGLLPIDNLLGKKDILISMAISETPEIRAAIQPIIAKTAQEKPEWSQQLLQFFVPILLQKETYEGLHADTLELLVNHLGDKLHQLPEKTTWKLIQSHYTEANLLGRELLQYLDFAKASLSDIISLADHEMPTIRQYCLDYFNENIGRVRYESAEALRLLDVKWANCRQFGFDFFDQHYKAGDWTPALLVSTCDSTKPDVQEFGKKMIVKFFDTGKGEDYLLQLSQHPNVSLQLFATNYLKDHAAGNLENFIQLKPYFKTVLCQLYKGGTTKQRISDFMESEALNNKLIAGHAVEILNEVALTVAIRDKARCIQVLHRIRRAYPDLGSVLEIEVPITG
ncbi:MAG: hypothetical protein AAGJ18_16315, partial [Bacteroidota bacterium]